MTQKLKSNSLRATFPILLIPFLTACGTTKPAAGVSPPPESLRFPGETHLANIRQLTFGGTNAEAYWSYDGDWLTFQHKGPGTPSYVRGGEPACDHIYAMRADGTDWRAISNLKGRTTCSFYLPDDDRILFSSTHGAGDECPANPDMSRGYVWPIYDTYQFYSAKANGEDVIPIEPGAPKAYNAEAVTCKDGSVLFTSDRDGDLDLYRAKLDRFGVMRDIQRLTRTLGYDGGAFFSPDCKRIVWRASRPVGAEAKEYQDLLKQHLVRPSRLEIWVANADGSEARQVTRLGVASFAPYFAPGGNRILFAANPRDPKGRKFEIYMINENGTGLERITHSDTFESFPMFSPDGKWLAFSSNRNGKSPRETNVFVADWVETPPRSIAHEPAEIADAADRLFATVTKLSAPEMEGRGLTTAGLAKSEDFVVSQFERIGLKPFFKDFKLPVQIQTGVRSVDGGTELKLGNEPLARFTDFEPAAYSRNGEFDGTVLDAGYGILAPELELDDYKGKDARNKIVLIRRHFPKGMPKGKVTPAQERSYSNLRYKAFVAREKGAKAVIFWTDEPGEELPKVESAEAASDAGIPVMFVRREIAEKIQSNAGTRASGKVMLERTYKTAHNVVGKWGPACGSAAPTVIGAHLDHLGYGSSASLEPDRKGIHHGADDNASGVAAMLEAARILVKNPRPSDCYLFAAFTGEELGVIGSSKLVQAMREKKVTPKAMLNLDMVGRMTHNRVVVFGVESAAEWKDIVQRHCTSFTLDCPAHGDGFGPSDHMPFFIAGVPVLHFFTGVHLDYHRPSDTADKINATGGVQVAELVAAIANDASQPNLQLSFRKAAQSPALAAAVSTQGGGDRRGQGAYLGTIPDYTAHGGLSAPEDQPKGVKLVGTRPDSPAEKAGVQGGDVLTSLAGRSIQNLEDMMAVLSALTPGEQVKLSVLRDGKNIELEVTIGKK